MSAMKIGTLDVVSVLDRLDLVAPVVAEALGSIIGAAEIDVVEIDPTLSDTASFCERYGVSPEQAANCVILEARRSERRWFAACVILGSTRADVNGAARKFLDARRASFAPMTEAVALTGMEYGAITPLGLPADWPILVDARVASPEAVVIGSGIRKSKLVISGRLLATLPNVSVLENLAR